MADSTTHNEDKQEDDQFWSKFLNLCCKSEESLVYKERFVKSRGDVLIILSKKNKSNLVLSARSKVDWVWGFGPLRKAGSATVQKRITLRKVQKENKFERCKFSFVIFYLFLLFNFCCNFLSLRSFFFSCAVT